MFKRFGVNFAIFSIFADVGCTLLALIVAVEIRPFLPHLPFLVPVKTIDLPATIPFAAAVLWVIVFLVASVYDPKHMYRVIDELQTVSLANGQAALLFAGLLYLFFRDFSRWLFVIFVAFNLLFLVGWRLFVRLLFRLGSLPTTTRRILIVGAGKVGRNVGQMILKNAWPGLQLTGYLDDMQSVSGLNAPVLGEVEEARHIIEQLGITDVVIALPQRAYGKVNKLALELHDLPVNVRVVPDYFSLVLYRAAIGEFGGLPMISLRDPALNDVQRLVKRLFDLCLATLLFLAVLPVMVVVGVAIWLDSPGNIFFKQQRVGENGQIFRMYKFRTMIPNAEAVQMAFVGSEGKIVHKRPDDPRVTRIGRFLRRTSLDELPQLLNVIKGDMSLVGPRPELPWLMNQYAPWQRKRFAVPQGMTGWWQVNGRADKPMHLYADDDLYYVQNYSLWMDIYILLKTPWVVMRGKGAY